MTMWRLRFMLVAAPLWSCGPPPCAGITDAVDLARIDDAASTAIAWIRNLPHCTSAAASDNRASFTGRLMPSGSGWATLVACEPEARCCNSFTPDYWQIVRKNPMLRVRVTFASGPKPTIATGGGYGCQVSAWSDVLSTNPLRATGQWYELPEDHRHSLLAMRGLRVEALCRVNEHIRARPSYY